MSTRSILHQARLNEWASKFAEQKSSGLSVTQWCKLNNLSRYKFFYWKRLLKEEAALQVLPDIVPLPIPSADTTALSSHILTTSEDACEDRASCATFATTSCARILTDDITIELDHSVPEALIKSLIKAVRHA